MRMVVIYTVSDGYSWASDVTQPMEYPSVEQFLDDLRTIVEDTKLQYEKNKIRPYFTIGGVKMNAEDFLQLKQGENNMKGEYVEPKVLTIDEWFAADA
jgi:hypothetical protein